MSEFDYDLFVIGAGSGGVRAARMSASFGAKVAIAEEYRTGGTCVIRGCIPKKLYVYASHFPEMFHDAAGYGWDVSSKPLDWSRLRQNKETEISRLSDIYARNLGASGVDLLAGRAVITGPHSVRLNDQDYSARVILIAVGATPFIPDFPGREFAFTSNEAFDLEALPNRVLVVGGGYIAVEFAGIFHGLGVKTHLVYRGEKILRGFDDDVRDHLTKAYTQKGLGIDCGRNITEIQKHADGLHVQFDDGASMITDAVMYATGRVPYTRGLGLETAGVKLGARGEVCVDAFSKTSCDSIYAVGDVTDRAALTPIAIREGAAFAQTVFNDNPQAVDHSIIPTAVFSQPEIGVVGLTEDAARDQGAVDIYLTAFRPLAHTVSGNPEQMLMKMIVDPTSDRILGLHIVGPSAGEMIQAFGVAVTMGATKAQFDATVAVHPTAAEEMVTFKEPIRR